MRATPLFDRVFLLLAVVGVAIRLVALHLAGELEPVLDEAAYLYHAACWEHFGFYTDSGRWLWPPGYPYFLKLALASFGVDGIGVAKLIQVLASGIVGYGTMLLAGMVFCRRAGFVAGGLWCVYLPMIGFTHYLWPETLFLACFVPALCLLCRWSEEAPDPGSARWLLPAGLLLGLAALFKEQVAYLPLLLLALVLRRHRGTMREGVRAASLFALAVTVVLFPWTLRNHEVYGTVTPVAASLGSNSWVGISARYRNFDYPVSFLAPGKNGYAEIYDEGDWRYSTFIERPEEAEWGWVGHRRPDQWSRNVVELSHVETLRALNHARLYPGVFLAGRVKQLSNWVSPTSFFVRHLGMERYPGLAKHPIARRLLLCGALLLSMLVLTSAVPGAVTALRGPPARAILLLPLIYALGTALLVGMSRHRMAIEPVLIVLAAGFLSRLRIGDLPGRERRAVFLGWGFLLFLWYLAAPEVTAAARSIWGGPA